MSYLNNHKVLVSDDLDEVHQAINSTMVHHHFDIRRDKENFDTTFSAADVGDLGLYYVNFGDVEMDVASSEDDLDALSVMLIISGSARVHQGKSVTDISSTRALIRDTTRPVHGSEKNFSTLGVTLPRAKLRQQACALIGPEAQALDMCFDDSFDPTTASGQVFSDTLKYVNSILDGPFPIHDNPLIAKQLEDLLLTQALALLPNSYGDLLSGPPISGAVPFYIKRARDHIHAHASESITVSDLATVAGCGYRTLQVAFNEAYGMPPMHYLRRVRLQKTHADFLSGSNSITVSAIAQKWGFTHLGRFAENYAREFGELPSATLRRSI